MSRQQIYNILRDKHITEELSRVLADEIFALTIVPAGEGPITCGMAVQHDGWPVAGEPCKAWMIEKHIDGVPHWWMRKPNQYGYWDDRDRWTTNPNIAKQYATRADAEYVIGRDMVGCIATEHVWMETSQPPTPGAEG